MLIKLIKVLAIGLVLAFVLAGAASAVFAGAWELPADKAASDYFADVSGACAWAAGYTDLLYEKGMASGVNGSFQPEKEITRGDFLLLVTRALGLSAQDGSVYFDDVPEDSVYFSAASAAYEAGIAEGSGGLFRPYEAITRQDAFTLVWRAAVYAGAEALAGGGNISMFTDSTRVASYAIEATANLTCQGVLLGSGRQVRPKDGISRGEAAALVCRLMNAELSGRERVSEAALRAAGLDWAEIDKLSALIAEKDTEQSAAEGGAGVWEARVYYVERISYTGPNPMLALQNGGLSVRVAVYLSGEFYSYRTETAMPLGDSYVLLGGVSHVG